MRKKYLIVFLGLFCCMGIKAIEREISLQSCSDRKEKWANNKRSITLEPTATVDGNTIRIYSNMTIESVSAVIKNQSGNIVYSNINMTPSTCHIFEVYDLAEGVYTLEFECGDVVFYGYFSYGNDI